MKKIIILFLTLAFLLAVDVPERNTLATYGEGVYEILPDTVLVNLSVQRDGLTAEEAQDALRKALSAVLKNLEPLDIPQEQLRTDGYSLYPLYKQQKTAGYVQETPEIDKYRAYIRLSIKLHQVQQMGKVVDVAVKGGANRVENIDYTLQDQSAAKREALKRAMENAQLKAGHMAESFNVKLVQPVSIEETGSYYSRAAGMNSMALMKEVASDSFSPPDGKVSFTSRVNVAYAIEPKPAPPPPQPEVATPNVE
ncbi:MAG: SIMPL domain-containing protein [Candidatus Margulisbacteria bacterium]|jgi:uncharacterized protein YggE|nr:SIMPL domain-containing protein [Candidatus Margulisiibacteriota bacterium]